MDEDRTKLNHLQQGVGGLVMLNVILDIIKNKEEIWKNMALIQIEFQKRIEEDKGSKVSIIEVIE